jgi:hypothetical protein
MRRLLPEFSPIQFRMPRGWHSPASIACVNEILADVLGASWLGDFFSERKTLDIPQKRVVIFNTVLAKEVQLPLTKR